MLSCLRPYRFLWRHIGYGEPIEVTYTRKGEFALFEMATVVVLETIPLERRNPLLIQTRGIGELLAHLVQSGVKYILIGVGGSASHDGEIGMAAGLVHFAGAYLLPEIELVLDLLAADQRLAQADLVIVGEGRLDRQSLAEKTPIEVARRTPEGVSVIAICGSLKADLPAFPFENICAAFLIIAEIGSVADTLRRAEGNLVRTAEQVARLLQLGADIEKGKQSLPE